MSRPAIPPQQPAQEEVLPEVELMDVSITDDLLDVINAPGELYSDFDPWAQSILRHQW